MTIKRNDRRDVDVYELKLMRAGHAVWAVYKQFRATYGVDSPITKAYLAACQDIWAAKREYRKEMKQKRAAAFLAWRQNA